MNTQKNRNRDNNDSMHVDTTKNIDATEEDNKIADQDFQLFVSLLSSSDESDVSNAIVYFESNPNRVDESILNAILSIFVETSDVDIIQAIISFLESYTQSKALPNEIVNQILQKYTEFFQESKLRSQILKSIIAFTESNPEVISTVISLNYITSVFNLASELIQSNLDKSTIESLITIVYFLATISKFTEINENTEFWTAFGEFIKLIVQKPVPETKTHKINWFKFLKVVIACLGQILEYQAPDEFFVEIINEQFLEMIERVMKCEGESLTVSLRLFALLVSRSDEIAILFVEPFIKFISTYQISNLNSKQLSFVALTFRNLACSDHSDILQIFTNPAIDEFIEQIISNSAYYSNKEIVNALCSLINTQNETLIQHTLEAHPTIFNMLFNLYTSSDIGFMYSILGATYSLLTYFSTHDHEKFNEFMDEILNADIEQALQFAEENGDADLGVLCEQIRNVMDVDY